MDTAGHGRAGVAAVRATPRLGAGRGRPVPSPVPRQGRAATRRVGRLSPEGSDMSTQRVLITGGAGFIGSHLTVALQAAGHAVVVVDDLSTSRRENVPDGATFHELYVNDPAFERV